MALGASRIATGHYARVDSDGSVFRLLRGKDASKDQSYFLHRLSQSQLARVLFPLGDLKKTEVRAMAAAAGLPNHAKKDSTGICFIGERPFREFLNRYLPREPGPMLTPEGRQVGSHIGLAFYTIGQRKGIGLGGIAGGNAGGAGDAWYVAGKDRAANALIVVQGHDHPLLMKRSLEAADASWTVAPPGQGAARSAKTRYRQADADCVVTRSRDNDIAVEFSEPQWAVTPGQSVVLYDGPVCLGGAIIR
jgi:tRNA-specific 2-thiouridylase